MIGLYAHLPGLRLAGAAQLNLARGRLEALEATEWRTLDPWRGERPGGAYERTRPVFYIEEHPLLADDDAAMVSFLDRVDAVQTAIILTSGVGLPDPTMSMAYLHDPISQRTLRRMGPMEREAILRHPVHLELAGHQGTLIDEVAEVVAATQNVHGALGYAIECIRLSTIPAITPPDGILICTMGLESILLGPTKHNLAATLSRRGAAIGDTDAAGHRHDLLRTIYRLRSEVLHGRAYWVDLDGHDLDHDQIFRYACRTLAEATLAAMRYLAAEGKATLNEWRTELDSRSKNLIG